MKKKVNFIIIIMFILLLIILSLLGIYLYKEQIVKELKQNPYKFTVDVYKKITLKEIIKDKKIINNYNINTKKLGIKNYKYYYLENNKKKYGYLEVKVVDKTPPLVWLNNSYNVLIDSEDNFKDNILCGDNYDKTPICKIEGSYDLNKIGAYPLKYIAIDSSNNKTEINFTLNVTEKKDYKKTETLFSDIYSKYKDDNNKLGLDISAWQKEVDFKALKDSGVSFVMLRVGFQKDIKGEFVLDEYFKKNIESALENDIDVGVYFYSKASTIKEARQQAKEVYNNIKNYDIKLPVVFDWEIYTQFNRLNINLTDLNNIANTFMKEIKKYGYTPALYGSKNYLEKIWTNNQYDTWLAHYTDKTTYEGDYFMWQLCMDGIIEGIDGYVDIDILYEEEL